MASIASLIVKIGANDQEIQKALASVGEKAKSLNADLSKLGSSPLAGGAQKSLENLRATMDTITKAQQDIATKATLAAQGLEAIGGASKLTDSQLKQVNKTLQDGLSAFKALGTEAPEHLKTIATSVEESIGKPVSAVQGKVIALGTAIGTFLGNAAIEVGRQLVDAAKATFDWVDALENLSAATGISEQGLQRLEAIGVTSGVSMDTLARSVEQLQKHLDDPAAIHAIEAMGKNYAAIRALKPEDQFFEIAKGVAAIEDPVERANAGAALFGKTWTTIAGTIKGDIQKVISETQNLTDDQIKAIDKAGDAWDQWEHRRIQNIRAVLGNLALISQKFDETAPTIANFEREVAARRQSGGVGPLPSVSAPRLFNTLPLASFAAPDDLTKVKIFGQTLEEQRDAMDAARVAAEKLKAVHDQLFGIATIDHANELVKALGSTDNLSKLTSDSTKKLHDELGQALTAYKALGRDVPPLLQAIFDKTAPLVLQARNIGAGFVTQGPGAIPTSPDSFLQGRTAASPLAIGLPTNVRGAAAANIAAATGRSLSDELASSIPDSILAAIQGGGSKLQAAGSALGLSLFGKDSHITKSITGLFSADGFLGKALKDTVPIIGSLIGPAIAGLQKLFGKSEESAKVSPLRDAFFNAAGGLDVLNPKVQALTGNLTAVQDVFKAKTVDDYNAAIQRLNTVLDSGKQAQVALKAAVAEYGITIDELGPKFAQLQLNDTQGTLLEKWKLLNAAVTDHNALLNKTAGAFQGVVTGALKSGATISEELQQPIQELADMGLLVDENGEKLTDLSRLKFGTLDTEFQTLTKAINNLTRALGGAVDEAENLAQDRDATITVHAKYDTSGIANAPDAGGFDGGNTGEVIEGFAGGTKGWRNFGAGKMVQLHGIEAVVTPDQVGSLNAAGAAASSASGAEPSIVINFNGTVLAATDWIEQNVVTPVLTSIERYHRPRFGRLVASVTP